MTYLPLRKWYLWPLKWMAKCQMIDVMEQLELFNAKMLDFRIRFDRYGTPYFAHGIFGYKSNVARYLQMIDTWCKAHDTKVYVRLILESNHPMRNQIQQEAMFDAVCTVWEKTYPNLMFCEGRRKYDWEVVHEFKYKPVYEGKYSSVTSMFGEYTNGIKAKIDDLYPWLYAKTHNKKNIASVKDNELILVDFIHLQ